MRPFAAAFSLFAFTAALSAQTPASAKLAPPQGSQVPPKAQLAPPQGSQVPVKDLPVRKVVLYKNGVGYFEHAGTVNGNQRVAIDFTSPQLNDVLQSLTVLDQGGGRVGGVNYNSTTPLAEQLKALSLGMTDDPSSTELFQALRGQRVEVTGGPVSNGAGGVITGRLMSIESRTQKVGASDSATTVDSYYLTLIAASGAVRVIELNPALSVRPLDASLQGQLDRYLELLSTTHSTGLRHLTLDSLGTGQRELHVSYISEVPVWKSTYRLVFPRVPNGSATMQGWAVVDNTVGADWDNVQLSLVAGAPQSFIQPLSQPLYTRRPEIPISTEAQLTPQTHEAAETVGAGGISGIVTDMTGAVIPGATVTATSLGSNASITQTSSEDGSFTITPLASGQYKLTATARGFNTYVQRSVSVSGQQTANVNVRLNVGSATETIEVEADTISPKVMASAPINAGPFARARSFHGALSGSSGSMGNGYGVDRASDALQEGDVTTNAFDDFFEYALTQPVTIHKNESAMVPILQQDLPAEHVTLWSQNERTPLRAVWLENKSKLTLDSGSFSIFESGEFAGEGLLDPIHPGERRLLSYAADQAVRVKVTARDSQRTLHHVQIQKGSVVETYMDVASLTYSATNSGDADHVVLLEHPRRTNGWTLDEGLKPAETARNLYRFRLAVAPHDTAKLEVRERGPEYTTVYLNANQNQSGYLIDLATRVPNAQAQLKPVIDAQTRVADLDARIAESQKQEATASADEARDRENLTALKGNDAAKRFVDELNRAEDLLQTTRKQTADLLLQKQAAVEKLNQAIAQLSFDWDATPAR